MTIACMANVMAMTCRTAMTQLARWLRVGALLTCINPFHYTQVLAASYRQHLDLAKCLIHKELPMPCCSETRCVKKLLSC